jgi:proteasome accessory factor B
MLQSRRGYKAEELARELEVSRRTIFRDLNVLEMARIPYYYDTESNGYKINQHFFLPPVNLTVTEALAMLALTGRLKGAKALPLLSEAARAGMKIEAALPRAIRHDVGSVIDKLSVATGAIARHVGLEGTFNDLVKAIGQKRICQLVYLSFHERKQIVTNIRPLALAFRARAWYLIAYSAMHRENRTFKLGRIRQLKVSRRKFKEPADVDLDEHFGRAWSMIPEGKLYKVHLHFEPKVAGNVAEVHWHDSQRVEWNDNGSIEFHVVVDGLREITWWILGYGDQVEVVAPAALRRRVGATAGRMVGKYRKEGR